jgi:hypothetical protein
MLSRQTSDTIGSALSFDLQAALPERRFPPPCSVEETNACFIDANGQSPYIKAKRALPASIAKRPTVSVYSQAQLNRVARQ